jgi:transmembrane sensor
MDRVRQAQCRLAVRNERIWSLKDELRFSDRREIEEAYNRFTLSQGKSKNAKPHFYIYPILKYVAAVLIIGLLGLNLYEMVQPSTVGENMVEVPKGQRASLMLSDGTKIWLNSHSARWKVVRLSGRFVYSNNVRLEGEAFFEVSHKEHLPFVVHSPLLAIKVLGTKFNVKAYFDEKSVVTLAEGKVEVETNDRKNRLTLKPNEQVSYSGSSGLALEKNINTNTVKLWMKGEGAFSQCRLDYIVRDLERKFNVKIVITDHSLSSEVFTCRFKDTATIEQVLHLLKETRRLDYSFEGEQIRIFKPLK